MSKRYNVVQAKEIEGREKPFWVRLGTAFEGAKGLSIKLDALPLPNRESEVWLKLFEQDGHGVNSQDGHGVSSGTNGSSSSGQFSAPAGEAAALPRADLDDDLPF